MRDVQLEDKLAMSSTKGANNTKSLKLGLATDQMLSDTDRLKRYRCAIDLQDSKRGTCRIEALNDIFRLLDLRHEIHEKAVTHRVVQAANAMMSRSLMLIGDVKPSIPEIIRLGADDHALAGEDQFLDQLLMKCPASGANEKLAGARLAARHLLLKLSDRRVYRPLMIIPGDRLAATFIDGTSRHTDNVSEWENGLRLFAALVDCAMYSPFLLYVSSCVEALLRGSFEQDTALSAYSKRIAEESTDSEAVSDAMKVIPGRVIIWTTPYKQLHKDPALVVQLGAAIGRIDEMSADSHGGDPSIRFARHQVAQSIANADSKYATLWKLYVFISDGLYYTGTYRRIAQHLNDESEETRSADHSKRLRQAIDLFVMALDVVWKDWTYISGQRELTSESLKERLEKPMAAALFQALVSKWIAQYEFHTRRSELEAANVLSDSTEAARAQLARSVMVLSTVEIDRFVHDQCSFDGNCRDIRYKSAKNISASNWARLATDGSPEVRRILSFLNSLGYSPQLADGFKLTTTELTDFVEGYTNSADTRSKCDDITSNSPTSHKLAALGMFCRSNLPQLETPLVAGSADVAIGQAPATINDWQHYLTEKASKMPTHVQARFKTERGAVIECITNISRDLWPELHKDMNTRFLNETRLCNNGVTALQIVDVVTRWARRHSPNGDQA